MEATCINKHKTEQEKNEIVEIVKLKEEHEEGDRDACASTGVAVAGIKGAYVCVPAYVTEHMTLVSLWRMARRIHATDDNKRKHRNKIKNKKTTKNNKIRIKNVSEPRYCNHNPKDITGYILDTSPQEHPRHDDATALQGQEPPEERGTAAVHVLPHLVPHRWCVTGLHTCGDLGGLAVKLACGAGGNGDLPDGAGRSGDLPNVAGGDGDLTIGGVDVPGGGGDIAPRCSSDTECDQASVARVTYSSAGASQVTILPSGTSQVTSPAATCFKNQLYEPAVTTSCMHQPEVVVLCSVGCCYHLLTEQYDHLADHSWFSVPLCECDTQPCINDTRPCASTTQPDTVGTPPSPGFPLSTQLQRRGYCLGRNARMVAAQPMARLASGAVSGVYVWQVVCACLADGACVCVWQVVRVWQVVCVCLAGGACVWQVVRIWQVVCVCVWQVVRVCGRWCVCLAGGTPSGSI